MNRQYNAAQFRKCVTKVKAAIYKPAITTDIIVGFPGETDEEFHESIEMARFAGFAKIHVFSFSKRKGTAAEKMKYQVSPNIIKQRSVELAKIDKELQKQFIQQFKGEKISVIIENQEKQTGLTGRHFEVKLQNSNLKKREFTYAILQDDCYHAICQ